MSLFERARDVVELCYPTEPVVQSLPGIRMIPAKVAELSFFLAKCSGPKWSAPARIAHPWKVLSLVSPLMLANSRPNGSSDSIHCRV